MLTIGLNHTVVEKALSISDSIFVTKEELGRAIDAVKTASQTGAHIGVVDADDNYYEMRVLHASDAGANLCVSLRTDKQSALEGDLLITIAQSVCSEESMKVIARGTTELGATEFVPLVTEHSRNAGALEWQRLDGLATKSSLLSGRDSQPRFRDLSTIDEALSIIDDYDLIIVFWERASEIDPYVERIKSLAHRAAENDSTIRIALVFGPEGGLTDSEVSTILEASDNAVCASLGPTVLSCDTAALVGVALVEDCVRRSMDAARADLAAQGRNPS